MKMVQVEFRRKDKGHSINQVVWVSTMWGLKPGDQATFRNEKERWDVYKVYRTTIDTAQLDTVYSASFPKGFGEKSL